LPTLAAVLAALLAAAPGGPPPPASVDEAALAEVRGAAVMADVRFLADDLLEGRKPGTRGYELAAKYVAARLETMGLRPGGEDGGFFQPVPLRESRLVEGTLTVRPRGGPPVALVLREDFLMSGDPVRTESRLEGAPVVFAGFGVTAPELDHDDYAGLDVAGKVVAALWNAPARFPSEPRAHYSSGRLKAANAARRGAVGFLLFATPEEHRRVPWSRIIQNPDFTSVRRLRPDGNPDGVEPTLQGGALLGPEGARMLFASSPVPLETVFAQAAEGRPRGFDLGATVELEARSEHRPLSSPNVVGVLEGSDPALRETSVVLSAHLDHIGVGAAVEGDEIYNGAYDNAMGTAVVLEAARVLGSLGPPPRSVVFLLVTSEEEGLLGSDHFATYPPAPAGTIVANVNVDMPLFLYPLADLVAFGGENSSLGEHVARAAREAGLALGPDPMPEENVFVRSDQYSFVRRGIPAVFLVPGFRSSDPTVDGRKQFGEFLARHYHRPSDDLGRPVHLESLERFVRANVALVRALASDPETPRWKPGNFFGETFGRPAR